MWHLNGFRLALVSVRLVLLLSACAGIAKAGGSTEVCLLIELDKTEYLIDEPIWLDIYSTICSEDSQDTARIRRWPQSSGLILFDAHGDTIQNNSPIPVMIQADSPPSTSDSTTWIGVMNLLQIFSNAKNIYHSSSLKVGTYHLEYVDYNHRKSNTLTFTVVEPHGVERFAHQFYASGLMDKFLAIDRSVSDLTRLLRIFPTSSYASSACNSLYEIYSIIRPDKQLAMEYCCKCTEDYPNSGWAASHLDCMIVKYGQSEALDILQRLVSESGSARLQAVLKSRY